MKNEMKHNKGIVFALIAVLLFALGGCVPGSSKNAVQANDALAGLPPMASTVGNYEDIELPADMKYSNKNSMSIRTDSFRGGIIHYTGRVEIYSLKEFIIASMIKNKWKLAGEVSSRNVILAFTKPNKTCMMNIEPNGPVSDTTLTMYVTVDVTASKTLNAFGEPIQ
ncbi:MAG TPA: hypothetical protein EYP35_00960 [Desulfobacterales bacterium]|nr:hypothetical protein [Desulfobacterales bacterium]HIP39799.1 hypothetical protein [Desulfocapsa sulfexigens]